MTATEREFTSGSSEKSKNKYLVLGRRGGCVFSVRPFMEPIKIGGANIVLNALRFRLEGVPESEEDETANERVTTVLDELDLPLSRKSTKHASMVAGAPVPFKDEETYLSASMGGLKGLLEEIATRFGEDVRDSEDVINYAKETWASSFEQLTAETDLANDGKQLLAVDFVGDTVN